MVCELHSEVKTAILVIAINTAMQSACSLWNSLPNCSVVWAWTALQCGDSTNTSLHCHITGAKSKTKLK